MKNTNKIIPIMLVVSFFSSCSNNQEEKRNNLQNPHHSEDVMLSSNASSAAIFQGYHSMGYFFTEKCIDKNKFIFPKNIENTIVSYEDNLKESDFRQKLNIGADIHVPMEVVDVTAGINYSKQASVSKLSRSTTYYAYVKFGESKLDIENENKLVIRNSFNSYFDAEGKLIDPFNFIKKCGDELVTSQIFSSKLLITLKLNFESQIALNEFNTKVGSVLNAFIL